MKLSGEQQSVISQLRAVNDVYKKQVAEEEARHEYALIQLREPVQRKVREARTLGVPETQIYRGGLDMSDYRTLDRFMVQTNGAPVAYIGQTVSVPVETGYGRNVEIVKKHERQWDVIDIDGEVWKTLNLMDADTGWVLSFYEPVPERIKEAISNAGGKKEFYVSITDDAGDTREEIWNAREW